MARIGDMTGQRYTRLVVLAMDYTKRNKQGYVMLRCLCRCDCGNEKVILAGSLRQKKTTSCGCLNREITSEREDRTGDRYGRLVVLAMDYTKRAKHGKISRCLVRCDCGNEKIVWTTSLRSGETKSCGCLHREKATQNGLARRTHGQARHGERNPLWRIWAGLRNRCLNERSPAYHNYGGRGINVDPRWLTSFETFLEDIVQDIGRRPNSSRSIDRIDNNGSYERGNVRWATAAEQAQNTRRNKFTPAKIQAIRLLHDAGECDQLALATACNVGRSVISGIVRRKTWKNIPDADPKLLDVLAA